MADDKFHAYPDPPSGEQLPARFTCPFHYVPHPLAREAAVQVQAYLTERSEWAAELAAGKMFGVLVVQAGDGRVGFLAAFSGTLGGENRQAYFVPPVYDLMCPGGFFRPEEARISHINKEIAALEQSAAWQTAEQGVAEETAAADAALAAARRQAKIAKERRDARRRSPLSPEEEASLIRESQHEKAELQRLKRGWACRLAEKQACFDTLRRRRDALKEERRQRSAALQQRLFSQFVLRNARGESCDLLTLFEGKIPPAGAGECAAPRLLQYAYLQELRPLAMAEFWWGGPPKGVLRRQGRYYPACKEKCEPILRFMLQGLTVEENPLLIPVPSVAEALPIVYEDEWLLVVNKPAGMLSVPGKGPATSVYDWARQRYPAAEGPLLVHRLDMATSGLLLIAKSKGVHQALQAQFKNRTVKKRYVALLEGVWKGADIGEIDLPLAPDPSDRPRQWVSDRWGKPAITRYEVLARSATQTRIAFYPLTGRTHQLRVHAAHPAGLDLPIVGDTLYGNPSDRLYLHAERLAFRHPVSGLPLVFSSAVPF